MNRNKLLLIYIALTFSCTKVEKDIESKEPLLELTFHFENKSDTVILGEQTDLAIGLKNNVFDSMNIFLGKVQNEKLIDTIGIIPVNKNAAFFVFIPNKLGVNILEGVVKEYNTDSLQTIVKSTPFKMEYYCISKQLQAE